MGDAKHGKQMRKYSLTVKNWLVIVEAHQGLVRAGQAENHSDTVNHLLSKAVKFHQNHHLTEIVLTNEALRELGGEIGKYIAGEVSGETNEQKSEVEDQRLKSMEDPQAFVSLGGEVTPGEPITRVYFITDKNIEIIKETQGNLKKIDQKATASDAVNHLINRALAVHNNHRAEIALTTQALRQLAQFTVDVLITRDPKALVDNNIFEAAQRTIRRYE